MEPLEASLLSARRALRASWLVASACAAPLLGAPLGAQAAPVDLNDWSAESYPAVAGFGAGVWTPAVDGSSVHQSVNGQPTLYVSDFTAFGTDVRGSIQVNSNNDDDYIGFAIGYQPGDASNASADYLLVDWKQTQQTFDFGDPSTTPGSTAFEGLAVSRVSGIPTADEFWGHVNFDADASGLQELARGVTLGGTGWDELTTYEFRFVFLPNSLMVFVDDQLELSIDGSFSNGSLAFYNFSQADVTYSAFTIDPVPEPSSRALMLVAAAALGVLAHERGALQRARSRMRLRG
ncbi:MAG TPA: PEP-CTERM sorting domain-containing protein [Myxococcota bacterium]|nr:PEP-CTERM sorting domain-containing protein [Myxococcota bacterium]